MSIRHFKGYWTIFRHDRPLIQCGSFMDAWSAVYSLYQTAPRDCKL